MSLSFRCGCSVTGVPPDKQPHLLPFLYLALHVAQGAAVPDIVGRAQLLRQFPGGTAAVLADRLPEPGGGTVQAVHVGQVHAAVGGLHDHVAAAYPAELQVRLRYELDFVAFHPVSEFLPREYGEHGQEDDFRVEPQRAVVQVVQVHAQPFEHLLHRVRVAVVERGGREQAGTQLVEQRVGGVDVHDLVHEEPALGARADEAHLALEHVPQLRELVQMVLAQETPHAGQPPVVRTAAQRRTAVGFRRGDHGTELVQREGLPMIAHTLLSENGLAAVLPLDGGVDDEEQRREDGHADDARHDVQHPLGAAGGRGHDAPATQTALQVLHHFTWDNFGSFHSLV